MSRLTPARAVILAAMLAPLLPMVEWVTRLWPVRAAARGIPVYAPKDAVIRWPEHGGWFALLALVALLVTRPVVLLPDPWLAAAVAVVAVTVFVHGAMVDLGMAVLFTLSALALTVVRSAPAETRAWAARAMGAAGVLQAAVIIQQWFGSDFPVGLWHGENLKRIGTLGNPGLAAGFVAVATLAGPWWGLPIGAVAILLTGTAGPLLAFAAGCIIRYRLWRHMWVLVAVGVVAAVVIEREHRGAAWSAASGLRMDVWTLALRDWARGEPILGFGLGAWARRIPQLQDATKLGMDGGPQSGYWFQAHNEFVQWGYELGLVGLVVLAGWLWTHRAMVWHPTCGGAVAALAALCCTWFPFHGVALGLLAVVVLACATAPPRVEVGYDARDVTSEGLT